MSHPRIHVPKPLAKRNKSVEMGLGAGMLFLMLVFLLGRVVQCPSNESYQTAEGSIQETRIVVAYTQDSQTGGHVSYRIEARVRYEQDGQQQERWLTASEVTAWREFLQAQLAKKPQHCLVYWSPKYPENARCRLEKAD